MTPYQLRATTPLTHYAFKKKRRLFVDWLSILLFPS